MNRRLLDTNALISVLRKGGRSPVALQMRRHVGELATSAIVAEELYRGAHRSRDPNDALERVDLLLAALDVLDFSREDAREAGRLDAVLAVGGRRIGPFDTLIAGQALARDLIVVTHNTGEFERVQGLRIEDWEQE